MINCYWNVSRAFCAVYAPHGMFLCAHTKRLFAYIFFAIVYDLPQGRPASRFKHQQKQLRTPRKKITNKNKSIIAAVSKQIITLYRIKSAVMNLRKCHATPETTKLLQIKLFFVACHLFAFNWDNFNSHVSVYESHSLSRIALHTRPRP